MGYLKRPVSDVPTTYKINDDTLEITVDLSEHGSFEQVKEYNGNIFIHSFKNEMNINTNITYGLDTNILKQNEYRYEIRNKILTIRIPVEKSIIRRILI